MTDKQLLAPTCLGLIALGLLALAEVVDRRRLVREPSAATSVRAPAPISPAPPSPSPSPSRYFDDFDVKKKARQIDWCSDHHGVPSMTFTRDRSNVICLKPAAVIELPREDAGR